MKFALKLFFISFLMLSASAVQAGSFLAYEKEPLPKILPPQFKKMILKNGIECFLLEDHTLPLVKVNIITRTGTIYDPSNKVGLAQLTGMLMRSGGAGGLSPEAFDKKTDDLGALLSNSIDQEMGKSSLEVLSEDTREGLGLLFSMVFDPKFDESRLRTAKLKIEENLRREDDDPDSLASRKFRQLLYGENSPWARRPSAGSLAKITLDDIRVFYKNYFKTNNMMFVAAGDFKTSGLINLLESLTQNAPTGDVSFPTVEEVKLSFESKSEQIIKNKTQSFVRMGHLGIKRENPDKFALLLAVDILGGGNFKSRLMEDIRTKRGMAYSVWSRLSPATDYGVFFVGVDTKASQTGEVIDLIKGHIKNMADGTGPTGEELNFAKQSALSQLVFEFDTAFKVVDQAATFKFFGYPDNYWRVFYEKMSKVSAKDIADVSKRYLHPDGLKIVVVGPEIKGLK